MDMEKLKQDMREGITAEVDRSTMTATIRPKGPIRIFRPKNADKIVAVSRRTHGGTWWISYQREKGNIDPERADRIIKWLRLRRRLRSSKERSKR